jgi:hypothetical protein
VKTSIEVAKAHGWKLFQQKPTGLKHKQFLGHVLEICRDKQGWMMSYPKPRKDDTRGGSSKALLDFLTKFHQTTFHGMTANKLVKEEKKKEKEKKPAAPDLANMTPRVEHGFFLQGPVKFAIDADDIFRTLSCGAFGIGQVLAREGILANLGETELKRWAEVNGLPTKPFARELLIEALRGVLQNAFYFAERDGLVPVRCVENQERRMREFYLKFDAFAKTATVKAERLQASLKSNGGRHVFVKKEECTWAATEKLTKRLVADLKGQQQPILEWLLKNKGTRSEIAAAVAAKLTTKQKPELVVGHYLPEWKKKGWIAS